MVCHRVTFSIFLFLAVICMTSVATIISREYRESINDRPPVKDDKVIKIGVILPFEGYYYWVLPKTGPGITYAVESLHNGSNSNGVLLKDYRIEVRYGDSKCSDREGPLVAIDMVWQRTAHVFLGPACDYSVAPIARFSSYWNIPVITAGAMVHAFSNRTQYPLLTRITGSYAKLGEFMVTTFKHFNWVKVGLIYNNNLGKYVNQGRSDCYFRMEAVFLEAQKLFKAKYGPAENIWSEPFDEKLVPSEYNYTSILKKMSKQVRSKQFFHDLKTHTKGAKRNTECVLAPFQYINHLVMCWIPSIKIRRSPDCLIFMMGNPFLAWWHIWYCNGPWGLFGMQTYSLLIFFKSVLMSIIYQFCTTPSYPNFTPNCSLDVNPSHAELL